MNWSSLVLPICPRCPRLDMNDDYFLIKSFSDYSSIDCYLDLLWPQNYGPSSFVCLALAFFSSCRLRNKDFIIVLVSLQLNHEPKGFFSYIFFLLIQVQWKCSVEKIGFCCCNLQLFAIWSSNLVEFLVTRFLLVAYLSFFW